MAANNHAMTHERVQTRQANRVCLSQAIKDTSFFIFTCAHCPSNFTSRNTLLMHMQIHVDKKIYQCRFCPYRAHQFCQMMEHIFRNHCSRKNITCNTCPISSTPYFENVHSHLTHFSSQHNNCLAKTLLGLIPDGAPENPEVIFLGSAKIYSYCILSPLWF